MLKTDKTQEQKLWTSFFRFMNDAYALKKAAESKAKAYEEAGDENAADALRWVAEYASRVDNLLSERDLDYALRYLDEYDDTIANNGKSFLNNFCGD